MVLPRSWVAHGAELHLGPAQNSSDGYATIPNGGTSDTGHYPHAYGHLPLCPEYPELSLRTEQVRQGQVFQRKAQEYLPCVKKHSKSTGTRSSYPSACPSR